jgi:hypothetical protein
MARSLGVKASQLRPRNVVVSLFPPGLQLELAAPSADEKAIAHRVLAFLEDRRVLYAPEQMETTGQCVQSVLEIRRFLTDAIGGLAQDSWLAKALRLIRAACRRFLDECDGPEAGHAIAPWRYGGDRVLGPALGELRAVTGVCVAAIADSFGLDVEPELAAILPAAPSERD